MNNDQSIEAFDILGISNEITDYVEDGQYHAAITNWTDTRNNKSYTLKTVVNPRMFEESYHDFVFTIFLNERYFTTSAKRYYSKQELETQHSFFKKIIFQKMVTEFQHDANTEFETVYYPEYKIPRVRSQKRD